MENCKASFRWCAFIGGSEQLAWTFQWILSATVAVAVVLMWRSRISYSLKAAALATGTLLITPYLFLYDMMVLAIPVGFLIRVGLRTGFRPYELPALGCSAALILSFVFFGIPVGLFATLIVASLILKRCGPLQSVRVWSQKPDADANPRGAYQLEPFRFGWNQNRALVFCFDAFS